MTVRTSNLHTYWKNFGIRDAQKEFVEAKEAGRLYGSIFEADVNNGWRMHLYMQVGKYYIQIETPTGRRWIHGNHYYVFGKAAARKFAVLCQKYNKRRNKYSRDGIYDEYEDFRE